MPPPRSPLRTNAYQPIADFLSTQDEDVVCLTYAQIEALIGSPLPDSAYTSASHWRTKSVTVARIWTASGWEVVQVDRRGHAVVFQRLRQE